jgi:hypothetical protein
MPSAGGLVVLHNSSSVFRTALLPEAQGRGSQDEILRHMPVTGPVYTSYAQLKGIVVVCRDCERGCRRAAWHGRARW